MSTPTTDTGTSPAHPVIVSSRTSTEPTKPGLTTFAEIVDHIYELDDESQENLVAIIQGQLRQKRRAEILQDVEQSRKEYAEGKSRVMTPGQIMNEVLGEA